MPIISQSSESILKLQTRLMSSTHAIMRFFKYFLCLLLRQTAEEDPIMRSAIQCSRDRIIVEFRGIPSNGSRLFWILRQDVIQCIVDVWESPNPRLWTCRSLYSFFGLTVSCQLLVIFKSDSWEIQVVIVDKYFLYYSNWKG